MKSALIVIDMLKDFIDTDGCLSLGEAGQGVIEAVRQRIEAARRDGTAVLFVADRHRPGDSEFEMFPQHCLEGTAGAEVIEEIRPRQDEPVISKRRYSAFFGTDLDITLREMGVGHLILVGVCTNICILYTAADARNLGYRVTVPTGAVASFDADAHDWALGQMETVLGVSLES